MQPIMKHNLCKHKKRPKILFVCHADNTHSQSWMDLLSDTEFDVRVFASPVDYGSLWPPQPWKFPTYVLVRPGIPRAANRVIWLLPGPPALRPFFSWAQQHFPLWARWLRCVIAIWKPDIVHTLRLNPEAWLTWQALRHIRETRRPRWIVSCWGSELNVESDDPIIRDRIRLILQHCDGFFADCRRDLRLAVAAGLAPSKLALEDPVPGSGGLNLNDFAGEQLTLENRDLIVVPKAYEGPYNKTLPILETLHLAEDALNGYQVHLLMCTKDVQMWLRRMPESLQKRCYCHNRLPQKEFLDMLKHARVIIATSLSDGTPNVMLEAMAAGALPLMSPLDSIQEWIEDERNGLLAPALHPDRIAAALRRALTDDDLFHKARQMNWEIIGHRANRESILQRVLDYYQRLLGSG